MKKLILAITALLTTMIMIAQPLYVHAADVIPVHEYTEIEEIGSEEIPANIQSRFYGLQYMLNSNAYEENSYFFYTVYKKTNGSSERYYEIFYTFSDATVSFENGYLDINFAVNPTGKSTNEKIYWYNKGSSSNGYDDYKTGSTYTHVEMRWGDTISINFYDRNGNNYSPRMGTSGDIANGFCTFLTNIPEIIPQEPTLDLSISFAYPFSGTMTRHTTGDNGLPTAADGNIMYVDNRRGDDAQFLMAIVPHGQTLSFNTWIYTGRDNIIGNPQYVYMCDEWQSFGVLSAINIGDSTASANSIYAACAWHASPAGSTRSYNLMYESMDLKANTEYDVLVYACLNPDMEEMSGFYYDNNNLGGTYSVCGTLTDVQLVYSSTFSMTDPMTFNPDYKNVHDSSYAWNPNDTNAGLWENGSAYKDENGNVVIKGFKTGSSTLSWENSGSGSGYNTGGGTGANINVNKAYGGFFGWFKGLLGILPTEYNLLILFGLTGMIAIGIIKAVK